MHIVYVIAPGGGPEAYVTTLSSWLLSRGHSVSVIYTVRYLDRISDFPSGVRVGFAPTGSWHYYLGKITGRVRAWPERVRSWETMKAAHRIVKHIDIEEPVDVIEVTEGIPISILRKRWAVSIRAHASGWTCRHFCKDSDVRWDHLLIRQEANQLRHAHSVSAVSNHLADHLSTFCDFPRERIQVIPLPINSEEFQIAHGNSQERRAPSILTVGRLEHRKGVDVLLRSLPKVWSQFPNLNVNVIGKEAQFTGKQLLRMVPTNRRSQVFCPGYISHLELVHYYQKASIYVAPTQYETFGYTILEAMACGLPIVTTPVGAIPELIEHGVNGLFVPFGDSKRLSESIKMLLSDSGLRMEMGNNNRQKALMFGVERVGPQMEDLYRKTQAVHLGQ